MREMLNERRSELTKAEDQMYKACGTQSYEATLAKVNATVEKLQVCLFLLTSKKEYKCSFLHYPFRVSY